MKHDFAAEVERLAELAVGAFSGSGGDGIAALELAIRTAMTRIGASLLEKLLAADRGHTGPRIDCGHGHRADFVSYRAKTIDTSLGPIEVPRAYYHCGDCHAGVVPRDDKLGIAGASITPGLRKMIDHAAAVAPFASAQSLLDELAGITLTTKRVERASETDGGRLHNQIAAEADAVAAGAVTPMPPAEPPKMMYVAVDGTGIPATAAATAGRDGKGDDGQAGTREVKLGTVFTQTATDGDGYPIRDPASSSYVATFEPAAAFGNLVYAEARKRGSDRAGKLAVLGDGAAWIWNLANLHFPHATHIVDLFHAREHLHGLAATAAGALGENRPAWLKARLDELDRGDIDAIDQATRNLDVDPDTAEELASALDYFHTNTDRMQYSDFRAEGLFVGSGVIEAGCKAVIGQRLKCSGMHWNIPGATGIATLRCRNARTAA